MSSSCSHSSPVKEYSSSKRNSPRDRSSPCSAMSARSLVQLQDRFWVMSCSAACQLAERNLEDFHRCSYSCSIHCPEGLLIMH